MKQVTNKTIVKQEEKIFEPVEVDGIIYWCESKTISSPHYVVYNDNVCFVNEDYHVINNAIEGGFAGVVFAQSQLNLKGIPVINLNSYVERLAEIEFPTHIEPYRKGFKHGYKLNQNHYNEKDIEKAYQVGHKDRGNGFGNKSNFLNRLEQINSISVIEIDEKFSIINYE